MLPSDLRQAEAQALTALQSALASGAAGRWTVELRFEGLKVLPLALRLAAQLAEAEPSWRLLFPDAGATALARRDAPALAPRITSLGDHRRRQEAEAEAAEREGSAPGDLGPGPLLLVTPSPSDYALVEAVCGAHRGAVVMLNPTLEDGAVGIGSVARARRKGFLAQWQPAYALQPFADSALRRAHPGDWELYRLDPDGFRLAARFPQKPTGEEQAEALGDGGDGGLGRQLRSLGDLIDNLQR
ncbi:MAG: DUF1995 family protein [Cyanobacteriota bacterium]|nr:DUF1995 family protein [Cyanobacteriota bacterium]